MRPALHVIALGSVIALAGCGTSPPPEKRSGLRLQATSFEALPGWAGDRHEAALRAFRRSCAKPSPPLRRACRAAARQRYRGGAGAKRFFEDHFRAYAVLNNGGEGLFTGYFEPILRGSRRRTGRYNVPLHARPADLGQRKPYPARAEILTPPLRDQLRAIAWLADPVDAFTLHIQGSGRIRLTDGSDMRVGVAATNGRRYVSIGRVLRREGKLSRSQASMQGIQAWLRAHPDEARRVMNLNPRYVFFREIRGPGPIGAQGVPLTSGRSLAIDPRFIRYGTPVWLNSSWPDGGAPLRRLVIAQDTGGAIKGPVRGDLFLGAGPRAFAVAGRMRQRGGYYLLLPRGGELSGRPVRP